VAAPPGEPGKQELPSQTRADARCFSSTLETELLLLNSGIGYWPIPV